MNSRFLQLLLALSLLLNTFVLAGFVYRSWIAPPFDHAMAPPPPPPGARGPVEMMANDLGLDQGQRKALRDVFDGNQSFRRQRLQEIQQLREQTGAEIRKNPVDWAKVDMLVEQVARLRGEAQKENLRAILALEPQLTPQQREKLHSVLADRFINPPRWNGPRPGGPERGQPRPPQ
jgi:Spy/CpxP family protein refolding chaperone